MLLAFLRHHEDLTTVSADESCSIARKQLNEAADYANAYRYRAAYSAAVAGINANNNCRDEQAKLMNKAFLLSSKGIAEYAFQQTTQSAVDLNLAIGLLEYCQAVSAKFDSGVSASCATQEQRDIETSRQARQTGITIRRPPAPDHNAVPIPPVYRCKSAAGHGRCHF